MDQPFSSALFWFRRDLRAHDNAGLYRALQQARQVWCAFVLDQDILNALPKQDRRVEFIIEALHKLDAQLRTLNPHARLIVRHARSQEIIASLAQTLHVQAVYANHDDEPTALARDQHVRGQLANLGIALHTYKDHVIFERQEVLTNAGTPYSVFTPYKNAWLKKLTAKDTAPYPVNTLADHLAATPVALATALPTLQDIGFAPTNLSTLHLSDPRALLNDFWPRLTRYDQTRNYPAIKGPSYLSIHLRFGTLSLRELVRTAQADPSTGAKTWLSELIWRDFYHQILHHHPHVVGHSFKPAYDTIQWEKGPHATAHFEAWCQGQTGYPLVDAAMRQINQTGYMHNRLRMITASFLIKTLGLDWRWGERYFALHLNDFDLAANNGGWQWAASTGCDAQPYFRIFNPITQSQKFDPEGRFIRRYVPELAKLSNRALHAPWLAQPIELAQADVRLGHTYPHPLVIHDQARLTTLARYGAMN